MARRHTEAAVLALVAALADPKQRVAAAVAILDRGWGKPKQTIEADVDTRPSWVVRAPPEVSDVADWFQKYAPREAVEHEKLTTDAGVDWPKWQKGGRN